jgi:hypothetical protein
MKVWVYACPVRDYLIRIALQPDVEGMRDPCRVELPDELVQMLLVDQAVADQLRQNLENLYEEACKAGREGRDYVYDEPQT